MPAAALVALVSLGACAGPDDYIIVTVEAPASVRGARALTITLANAGTTRMDTLALDGAAFPVTFSVSTPGRTGDLAIAIDATGATDLVVGRGATRTTLGTAGARVVLDTTDFVVNTEHDADQFTSNDFEAGGFQLAARPDGSWTAAFRDNCPGAECTVFARRFDATGAPVTTNAASDAFPLTTRPTTTASTPALAASANTTLAVWDFFDVDPPAATGVACRAIDAGGVATATQRAISDDVADVISIAALTTGDFIASWTTASGGIQGIRAMRIAADCTPLGAALA
ncbi:MAG: hypothetical protein H7138_07425, partial [Myxococcales bacterium]|nr:hypothetical protein [Myxococcales bacterium]